ncbi:unnamed protein product [Arctogadus glacialis]
MTASPSLKARVHVFLLAADVLSVLRLASERSVPSCLWGPRRSGLDRSVLFMGSQEIRSGPVCPVYGVPGDPVWTGLSCLWGPRRSGLDRSVLFMGSQEIRSGPVCPVYGVPGDPVWTGLSCLWGPRRSGLDRSVLFMGSQEIRSGPVCPGPDHCRSSSSHHLLYKTSPTLYPLPGDGVSVVIHQPVFRSVLSGLITDITFRNEPLKPEDRLRVHTPRAVGQAAPSGPFRPTGTFQNPLDPPSALTRRIIHTIGEPSENHRRTVGEPWENHGRTMGEPWENHPRTVREPSENRRRTVGESSENHRRTIGDPSENHRRSIGEPSENHVIMTQLRPWLP